MSFIISFFTVFHSEDRSANGFYFYDIYFTQLKYTNRIYDGTTLVGATDHPVIFFNMVISIIIFFLLAPLAKRVSSVRRRSLTLIEAIPFFIVQVHISLGLSMFKIFLSYISLGLDLALISFNGFSK